jgi:hypothetical protein
VTWVCTDCTATMSHAEYSVTDFLKVRKAHNEFFL